MSISYSKLDNSNKKPLKKVQIGVAEVPPVLVSKGVRVAKAPKRKLGVTPGFPTLLKS